MFLLLVFSAAPPAPPPPEWHALVARLADDDHATRKDAARRLDALGEPVLPLLARFGKTHDDPDARLRALVVKAGIEARLYGEARSYRGHTEGALAFALSPDGKRLASTSWEGGSEHVARVWDIATGKETLVLAGHRGCLLSIAWSHDDRTILTGSIDGTARLWDASSGRETLNVVVGRSLYGVALLPDGKRFLATGTSRRLDVIDLATGKTLRSIAGHTEDIRGVAVVPGGKLAVTGSFART
ncbi:MAG: hypothetical protein K2W96_25270, partial [Gemmataceae bacterium]|nr:hypothetical protein [Gemmataceae bacterium]